MERLCPPRWGEKEAHPFVLDASIVLLVYKFQKTTSVETLPRVLAQVGAQGAGSSRHPLLKESFFHPAKWKWC